MSVRLDTTNKNAVHISELKNGQIAEILSWGIDNKTFKGLIIQRCGNSFFGIGTQYCWSDYFIFCGNKITSINSKNLIRILELNETITITEN